MFHPVGTCRMSADASDKDAVTDTQGRVRGFEGLRAMSNVAGIVVTMPLKQLILPLVDEVLPRSAFVAKLPVLLTGA